MATPFYTSINLNKNEIINVSLEKLSSAPTAPVEGQIYYNTSSEQVEYYNGTNWIALTTDISGVYPIQVNTDANGNVSISIAPATNVSDGYLSAQDKAKLDAATDQNVPSAIVVRNSSGTFNVTEPTQPQNAATKNYVDSTSNTFVNNLFYRETIGDGVSTNYTITHNLNDDSPIVQCYDVNTSTQVLIDVESVDANNILISSDDPLQTDEIQVTVIGIG